MLRTGLDLSAAEIREGYDRLPDLGGLGPAFLRRVLEMAGDLADLRVLDVGCGRGELLAEIARRWPSASAYGLDISVARMAQAGLTAGARAVAADGTVGAPFRGASFDRVFCLETLEHLQKPESCLREIARVLAPRGRAILSVPNATGFAPFHRLGPLLAGRWLKGKLLPYEHPANTTQPIDACAGFGEILSLIRGAGFEIDAIRGWRYFRYLEMLPGTRGLYPWLGHVFDGLLPRVGGIRFAYNLVVRCRPARAEIPV